MEPACKSDHKDVNRTAGECFRTIIAAIEPKKELTIDQQVGACLQEARAGRLMSAPLEIYAKALTGAIAPYNTAKPDEMLREHNRMAMVTLGRALAKDEGTWKSRKLQQLLLIVSVATNDKDVTDAVRTLGSKPLVSTPQDFFRGSPTGDTGLADLVVRDGWQSYSYGITLMKAVDKKFTELNREGLVDFSKASLYDLGEIATDAFQFHCFNIVENLIKVDPGLLVRLAKPVLTSDLPWSKGAQDRFYGYIEAAGAVTAQQVKDRFTGSDDSVKPIIDRLDAIIARLS